MNYFKKIIALSLASLLIAGFAIAGIVQVDRNGALVDLPLHESDSVTESAPFLTYDISGNENDGVLGSGVSEPTKLTDLNGFSFDGTSDRIRGGTTDELLGDAELSLVVWVTADDTSSSQGVITIGNPFSALGAAGIFVGSGGNAEISVEFAGGNSHRTASGQYTAGETFFLVMTKAAGAINTNTKIYKNASEVSSASSSINTPNLLSEQYLVGSFTTSSNFFDGNIYKAQIYDYALTQTEITALYNEGLRYQYTEIQNYSSMFIEPFISQANTEARDGVISGDPVIGGGVGVFDGTDSIEYTVNNGDEISGGKARTFRTWLNFTGTGGTLSNLTKGGGTQEYAVLAVTIGATNYMFSDGINSLNNITWPTDTFPNDGKDHQFVFSLDDSDGYEAFLDGMSIKAGTFAVPINTIDVQSIVIGERTTGGGDIYVGSLSSTEWFIGDWTAQQVLDDFNNKPGMVQVQGI